MGQGMVGARRRRARTGGIITYRYGEIRQVGSSVARCLTAEGKPEKT